ncbi:MAG TPA: hypothetical protein VJH37_02095 [Candidatus Nanoarchaeia archaeon]|nr:hypothetical protein [Candidatus Nanoarchaeia archaeon]
MNDQPALPSQQPQAPKVSEEELKKKFDKLKGQLEKFKKKALENNKEIIGIALLPPEKKDATTNDVLVLIDDTQDLKEDKFLFRDKVALSLDKIAKEIDKDLKPQALILTELREACFDGKYELINLISYSFFVYDVKDLLSALKVSEIHRSMVIKKFEKYVVSYVAVGSLFRGDAKSNDIDIAIVIDDTDVKKMNRLELRDKLGAIIRSMGYEAATIAGVKKEFHIQVYILTDFWEAIKEASPVIFTFLRDGVPLYDRGIFMSWKLLLQMGRIRPSPEAIDVHMDMGSRLVDRAKGTLLTIVGEDLYYAALNPSQAALMLYGVPPPTPKETVKLVEEIFVKREKLLEQKYANILANTVKTHKDIEHGVVKEITGKKMDQMLTDVKDYLQRIKKLFSQIEKQTEKKFVHELYESCKNAVEEVFVTEKMSNVKPELGLKRLVDQGKFPKKFLEDFKDIIKVKDNYTKMNKHEIEKVRRETATFIRAVVEYVQRKRGAEVERARIRIKYGEKFGDIFLLESIAFIIEDIDAEKKEVAKANLLPNGGLGELQKSSLEEFEKALAEVKLPRKVFIKEKIFEDLRKLYGKDVEVQVSD